MTPMMNHICIWQVEQFKKEIEHLKLSFLPRHSRAEDRIFYEKASMKDDNYLNGNYGISD